MVTGVSFVSDPEVPISSMVEVPVGARREALHLMVTFTLPFAGGVTGLAEAVADTPLGNSFTLNSTTANGPRDLAVLNLSVSGITASPVTEFFNTTLGKDFLFVGVTGSCTVLLGSGCVRSIDITSGFPAAAAINNVFLNAAGGTGRIIVDNNSSQSQASSVYYTTLTGSTIVKATQSALQ